MKTINISSNFALIVYKWKNRYPTQGETAEDHLPGELLSKGVHYIQFSRSKKIGGNLEIDIFAEPSELNMGDWVVLKTSAKGKFTQENFSTHGTVKFIGQVYSKNTNFFADAEGILRKTIKVSVKEWSHVFYIPVRYDIYALQNNPITQVEQLVAATGNTNQSDFFNRITQDRFNPFKFASVLLQMIGGLSSNRDVIHQLPSLYKVSTRLPFVPKGLYEDHIAGFKETGQPMFAGTSEFSPNTPWSTGFMWPVIGVQNWSEPGLEVASSFVDPKTVWSKLNLNLNSRRPAPLNNPSKYAVGMPFISILESEFDDNGLYEHYTDMWYMKDEEGNTKVAPVFVFRDNPVSMKQLWTKENASSYEGNFGWTYYDNLPRTTVDIASVQSINMTVNSLSSPNYIRYNFKPGIYLAETAKGFATQHGTAYNLPSQNRIGGIEQDTILKDFSNAVELKISKNINGKNEEIPNTAEWFRAVSVKMVNHLSYNYLFPRGTIEIKDDDYPISVGFAVRIPLGENRPTLVGSVESINYRYSVTGEGKQENKTYIELSRICFEDEDKTLYPMPLIATEDLLSIKSDDERLQEYKNYWKFLDHATARK